MWRKSFVSLAVVAAVLSASGLAGAQTVDDIIAKNQKAKGGDKWKAVQSFRMSAKVSTQGIELPMTMVAKRPNMMRQDMGPIQGMSIVQAFDGTTAWQINPMMGSTDPSEVSGGPADLLKEQADFDGPLTDYKAKGNTVTLVGTEDVNGVKAHRLKITRKSGQAMELWIDANTGLEVKSTAEVDIPGMGPTKLETTFGNYQTVDGITVPMSITQSTPQGPVTITFDRVEFNVALDDKVFRMPGK